MPSTSPSTRSRSASAIPGSAVTPRALRTTDGSGSSRPSGRSRSASAAADRPSIFCTRSIRSSSDVRYSPTSRPLRSTVMRSQISYTWSRKCETNRIATPRVLSSRMTRNSSATSSKSRLEVGSSSTSTLTSVEMARAMATSCCTASGCAPSTDAGSISRPRSASASCAQLRMARQSIAPRRPRGSRPSAMFSATVRFWQEVDLLVDRADAGLLRVTRRRELHHLTRDADDARVQRQRTGERLDERRLARAVLAHERVDLAREHAEVDVVERGVRPESHCRAGHLHQRQQVVHGAYHAVGRSASPCPRRDVIFAGPRA